MANTVTIRIDADAARAISQINATALSIERLDKAGGSAASRLRRTGATLTRVGGTMTRQLTVPIGLAGAAAVKTAIDFDQSMNRIQALVGASEKQVDSFRESILDLAPTVGKSPKELADALYFITSSGFSGAKALDVLTVSAKASAAGLGETQTVADAVTSAVNAYGQANLSASDATDILVATVREGKGEPQDLADAMGRIVAPAQAAGVSFNEVGAALSALTLLGLDADESVTGLTGAFRFMSKPSSQGAAALESVGLSAESLRKEVADKGLLPSLIDLRNRFGDNVEQLRKVIPEQRAWNAFLILTGKNAGKNAKIFQDLADSTGDTERAFEKTGASARQNLNQALAELQVAGVKIGGQLVPVLADVASGAAGVAEGFGELPDAAQQAVVFSAVTLAALGPVVSTVGNVAKAAAGLSDAWEFLFVANPVLGAAAVAAAAVAGGILFAQWVGHADQLHGAFDGLSDSLRDLTGAFISAKDAGRDKAKADLLVEQSTLDVKTATKAVNRLNREGKRGTDEYRQAIINKKNAELRLADAIDYRRQKTADAQKKDREARKTIRDLRAEFERARVRSEGAANAIGNMGNRSKAAGSNAEGAAKAAHEFADRMRDVAEKAGTASAKLVGVNNKAAAAAGQLSHAAGVAAALADSLNRIPTQKEINIFIHTFESVSRVEENRLNRQMGGTVIAGHTYRVNEQARSRTPELFTPDVNGRVTSTQHARAAANTAVIQLQNPVFIGTPNREVVRALTNLVEPEMRKRWARRG